MRTIIKLLVIGTIAGFAYKYIVDKNIEVVNLVDSAIAKTRVLIDLAIENHSSTTLSEDHKFSTKVEGKETHETYTETYSNSTSVAHQNHSSEGEDSVQPKVSDISKAKTFTVSYKESVNPSFKELDLHAFDIPSGYSDNLKLLVSYLVKPAINDLEKARVIFRWIANNISYDDQGYNTGNYADGSALGVFNNRTAVCDGFSELFMAMGKEAGLEIEKISGYSKGYGYRLGTTFGRTNHAWNAIKIDGEWRLFDVTWGQGHGKTVNGKLKSVSNFNDFWFNTDPYAFIFTHLPQDSRWQLIDYAISKTQFERLPYVHSSFFAMGFQGESILNEILNEQLLSLPTVYGDSEYVQAISLPASGTLMHSHPIRLVLKSTTADAMAIINNGKWTHFEKIDDTYSLTFHPQQGELKVSARFNNQGSTYSTLLAYWVR
jgi:transglutaminase/protease-like cytokinesis protein 3